MTIRSVRMRLVLPITQTVLAILLELLTPYYMWLVEWPQTLKRAGVVNGVPTPALSKPRPGIDYGQLLVTVPRSMSLPAHVLSSAEASTEWHSRLPHWSFSTPNRGKYGPRKFHHGWGLPQLTFFGGVALLWYWVGTRIDAALDRRKGVAKPRRRAVEIVEMLVAVILGLYLFHVCLMGILEYYEAAAWLPEEFITFTVVQNREIMTLGLAWPVGLLAYFFFSLHQLIGKLRA